MKTQKSYVAKPAEVKREWLLIDGADRPLGRVASQVAMILRGKHKPTYTPHTDTGDFVVVINSDKLVLTGNKMEDKEYFSHSGFPGGAKYVQAKKMMANNSDRALERAIKGMLPKNSLGRQMFRKLKVHKGDTHPHEAQKPRLITANEGGAK
ncbi:MAG: 50S ribosomal protein L13 [Firmicutes bacterium]|nr:50S ribosomal protein L13 [Bacillota bacterium]